MHATLRSVMVFVGDVERCADWYETHFGLPKVMATHVAGVWQEVELGGGATIAFLRYLPSRFSRRWMLSLMRESEARQG